ncbi:MAG: hypothetical protein AB1706_18965 [Pseudomonadota bacterium]
MTMGSFYFGMLNNNYDKEALKWNLPVNNAATGSAAAAAAAGNGYAAASASAGGGLANSVINNNSPSQPQSLFAAAFALDNASKAEPSYPHCLTKPQQPHKPQNIQQNQQQNQQQLPQILMQMLQMMKMIIEMLMKLLGLNQQKQQQPQQNQLPQQNQASPQQLPMPAYNNPVPPQQSGTPVSNQPQENQPPAMLIPIFIPVQQNSGSSEPQYQQPAMNNLPMSFLPQANSMALASPNGAMAMASTPDASAIAISKPQYNIPQFPAISPTEKQTTQPSVEPQLDSAKAVSTAAADDGSAAAAAAAEGDIAMTAATAYSDDKSSSASSSAIAINKQAVPVAEQPKEEPVAEKPVETVKEAPKTEEASTAAVSTAKAQEENASASASGSASTKAVEAKETQKPAETVEEKSASTSTAAAEETDTTAKAASSTSSSATVPTVVNNGETPEAKEANATAAAAAQAEKTVTVGAEGENKGTPISKIPEKELAAIKNDDLNQKGKYNDHKYLMYEGHLYKEQSPNMYQSVVRLPIGQNNLYLSKNAKIEEGGDGGYDVTAKASSAGSGAAKADNQTADAAAAAAANVEIEVKENPDTVSTVTSKERTSSPLILDTNKNGLVEAKQGEGVDINNDGKADGAATGGDKMLAMTDANGNHKIDGSEVFGDKTVDPFTGKPVFNENDTNKNGFEALKRVASSADKYAKENGLDISALDKETGEVNLEALNKIMQTAGLGSLGYISDNNDKTLEALNTQDVKSVNTVDYINKKEEGNIQHNQQGTYIDNEGIKQKVDDVWFKLAS